MKRFIVFMAFAMAICCSFAQKIAIDKTYSDNSRGISCNSEVCRNFTDRVVASFALSLFTNQDDLKQYNVSVSFLEAASVAEEFSIPDNATLLIRTADEAVLQLKCGKGNEDYFGDLVKIGNSLVNMKSVTALAPITEEDLTHLMTGIIKVRCELNSSQLKQEFYENNFKKAKLGQYFTKAKALIEKTAAKKTKGNITEDF